MPRISGLFAYARKHVSPKNFNKVTKVQLINEEHATKPTALILFLSVDAEEFNPFDKRGFQLGSKAHLRIDQEYHSSRSPVPGRQNLSYCHGTEYFHKANETIEVHYYFDRWGSFTHARCTLFKKDVSGVVISSELIEPNLSEHKSIKERAQQYGELIRKLIDDKKEKYLALAEQIERTYSSLMEYIKTTRIDKRVLDQKLAEIQGLIKAKNDLDDDGRDVSFKFFNAYLQKLQEESLQEDRATEEDVTERPPSTNVTTASTKPMAKPRAKAAPNKPTKEEVQDALLKLERDLAAFEENKDKFDLTEYLTKLDKLRSDLLFQILQLNLDGKLQKKANDLWSRVESIPAEMALFRQALLYGDVVKIKSLFNYCRDLVTPKIYDEAVWEWMHDQKNVELVKKRELAFDFLNENCSVFNYFMRNSSLVFYQKDGLPDVLYNFLCSVYRGGNQQIFAALLRYGIDPFVPWMKDRSGVYRRALYVLTHFPQNTEFYLNSLIEAGITIDGTNEPYSNLSSGGAVEQIAKTLDRSSKKQLEQKVAATVAMKKKMDVPDLPIEAGVYKAGPNAPLSLVPLADLSLNNTSFYQYPLLYSALVDRCDLAQKLVSLAVIFGTLAEGAGTASRSNTSEIVLCKTEQFPEKLGAYAGQTGNKISVVFGLNKGSFPEAEFRNLVHCTQRLLSSIRAEMQNISAEKIAEIKTDLEIRTKGLVTAKDYVSAAQYQEATTFLFVNGRSLSEDEYISYIKVLSRSAFLFECAANALPKLQDRSPTDPILARNYAALKQDHSNLRYSACESYLAVLSTGLSDPEQRLVNHDLVKRALESIKNILGSKLIVPAMQAQIMQAYQTFFDQYSRQSARSAAPSYTMKG